MQQDSAHRSFSAFDESQRSRPVRPLARRALETFQPRRDGSRPVAVELGSGAGIEARFLAEHGIAVHAFDGDPSVGPLLTELSETLHVTAMIADLGSLEQLPAADLFGDCDDWAGTEGTYPSRAQVEALLEGFEVLDLVEEERDSRSFSGPEHWHTFQVLARRQS